MAHVGDEKHKQAHRRLKGCVVREEQEHSNEAELSSEHRQAPSEGLWLEIFVAAAVGGASWKVGRHGTLPRGDP